MNAYHLSKITQSDDKKKMANELLISALENYVKYYECDGICSEIIRENIRDRGPSILYRGHKKSDKIKNMVPWFSTSKSKKVAQTEFMGDKCCLFIIHLDNDVPVLDVNKHIGQTRMDFEQEFIVLGGGNFYTSSDYKIIGFQDIGNGQYETWYSMRSRDDKAEDKLTVERVLDIIPTDEYDFIDSPDDIMFDISPEKKIIVFNKIKNL